MGTSYHDYAQRRLRGADILERLALATSEIPGADAEVEQLGGLAERTRAGRFVIHLVGCFSSGKSTLLNAILGQPVLPVKVNPCTAILTEIAYAEQPGVTIDYRSGRASDHISPDAFSREYQLETLDTEQAGTEAQDRFGDIARARIGWPLPLLADGVCLYDTPGLDDDPVRTRRTLDALPSADAVIFVLNATRFLTELERATLHDQLLPLGLDNLFFPTTMVDLLSALSDEPARELDALQRRARAIIGPLCHSSGSDPFSDRFFLVNPRGALREHWDRETESRRLTPDEQVLEQSGMPALEHALEHFLVHERGAARMRALERRVRVVHTRLQQRAELDRATTTASAEELRARQEKLEPKLRELEAIARRVRASAAQFVEDQKEIVWLDLRDFLAETERQIPDALRDFELGRLGGLDLLTPGGRERVEKALREHLTGWLEQRLGTWEDSVRPRLLDELEALRAQLAPDATDFDELARTIVTDFAGGVEMPHRDSDPDMDPIERWFSVAIGAVLLSPGTVAAGWTEGYSGALKGAASRLAARITVLALGALLGPIGWAALGLYVVSDALLLALTGGGQMRRMQSRIEASVRGRLVAQATEAREGIRERVGEALAPLRDALGANAEIDAASVRSLLDTVIADRADQARSAEQREALWTRVLGQFEAELGALEALSGS